MRNRLQSRSNKSCLQRDYPRLVTLLLPGIILLGMFTLYPIVKMFIMSFFNWRIGYQQTSDFVGLRNYIAVFSDPTAEIGRAHV